MSSLKIYEASTLLSSMNERIKDYQNLKEQLEALKAAFQEIVHLSDFKGKAADAIKGFYRAQIDVVNAWEDFFEQHIQFLKSVEGSVADRNLSGNTLVHVPFLEETLKKAAQRSNEIVSAKEGELKRIFRNIDDIISLKVFSSEEFDNQMYMAEKERKDTLDKVHELDYYLVNEYQKSQPAESYTKLLFQQLLESSRKDGSISPINFNSKSYHNSEIYQVKSSRFISKKEFESIDRKLAYKTQIIDEHEEFGGDYYVFDNGLIVRKFTARMDGKFVTRYEIVTKIPGKDRTGGVKELDSFLEGTPLAPLEYLVNPKNLVIKGGKKLLSKSLKDIEERLTVKVEKNQLAHAGAYNGYVESNLHIEKFVDPIKIEKKAVDESKSAVNKGTGNLSEKVKYGEHFTKVDGKKALKPNIEYTTKEGYQYKTDGSGRISNVEAKLELGKAERNLYAQRTVGGENRLSNDDGGHLIASIFKGSGEIDNLVPMDATLNRKEYKAIETTWKKALGAGKEVSVKVKPIHEGKSSRPTEFKISYTIDGKKYSDRLTNYPGGK